MFIERLTLNQPLYSSVHVHHHILSHKSCVVGAAIIVTSHTYVVNKVLISQFLCDKVSIQPSTACRLAVSPWYIPASLCHSAFLTRELQWDHLVFHQEEFRGQYGTCY